jgi:hypothetical protein
MQAAGLTIGQAIMQSGIDECWLLHVKQLSRLPPKGAFQLAVGREQINIQPRPLRVC